MGMPVLVSVSSAILSPAGALPRMPCSGASSATSSRSGCAAIRPITGVFARSTALWLLTSPTRLPRRAGGTSARNVSMPGRTVWNAPAATAAAVPITSAARIPFSISAGYTDPRAAGASRDTGHALPRTGAQVEGGHLCAVPDEQVSVSQRRMVPGAALQDGEPRDLLVAFGCRAHQREV